MAARIAVILPDGTLSTHILTPAAIDLLIAEMRLGETVTGDAPTAAEALAVLLDGIGRAIGTSPAT